MRALLTQSIAALILCAIALVTQAAPLEIRLIPDPANPARPTMGDHLHFRSQITNNGAQPIEGLVAWISLVQVDPGHEQPVDLEDWSARKAVTGATLASDTSLGTDWPMRLISSMVTIGW
jgi:hypothetical protein